MLLLVGSRAVSVFQENLGKTERRAGISLALIYAFRMLGLFMILPVFALYEQELAGLRRELEEARRQNSPVTVEPRAVAALPAAADLPGPASFAAPATPSVRCTTW